MYECLNFVIDKDLDIREEIMKFVLGQGWEAAYISGAIGSVKNVKFTTPISMELPPVTTSTDCNLPAEILSFTGEIMKREKMDPVLEKIYPDKTSPLFVHIHASIAVSGGHVYGGGLQAGKTLRSLRVFIQQLDN